MGLLQVSAIAVSPFAPRTVFAGGAGLWRTVDGGLHWSRWGRGLTVPDVLSLLAGDRVYTSTSGSGVWERDA
jgi:hypothetical protein